MSESDNVILTDKVTIDKENSQYAFAGCIVGFGIGIIILIIVWVVIINSRPYWEDYDKRIIGYEGKLYKLVEVTKNYSDELKGIDNEN